MDNYTEPSSARDGQSSQRGRQKPFRLYGRLRFDVLSGGAQDTACSNRIMLEMLNKHHVLLGFPGLRGSLAEAAFRLRADDRIGRYRRRREG